MAERAIEGPGLTGASRLPRPSTVLEQALQGARRLSRSIIAPAAGLGLFPSAAHAHDRWDNGEPVPGWVKTECCGPKDAHHLRPDQVRRNAAGDYVVDIHPDPIPAHIVLPSQDGSTGCSSTTTTASTAVSGVSSYPRCFRPHEQALDGQSWNWSSAGVLVSRDVGDGCILDADCVAEAWKLWLAAPIAA